MSTRSYRGNRGKNVYEIANFSKGVNATNAAMPPGYLKELVNMNISPDGLSLRPREPYLNYALYLKGNDNKNGFVTLSNQVGMFISKQFPNWEFIIDFFGKRNGYEKEIEDYRIIDGDTFVDNKTGIRYRLLIVDAHELGTVEGQQAKEFVELITNGNPITVRYDSQAPSWVDKYNRHLVWAETKEGLNIQRSLITYDHAKYLDLRVTEHEFGILKNVFGSSKDYEGNSLQIEDYPGGIPVVYRRDINKPPEIIEGRPAYILHEFNNIFMGDMLNDLEIGYSFVPSIKINKVNSEFGRYRTEYNPLEQNKMPNHDGIVSLVDIDPYLPVETVGAINLYIRLNNDLNILEDTPLDINGDIIFPLDIKITPSIDLIPFIIKVEGVQTIESVEILELEESIGITNGIIINEGTPVKETLDLFLDGEVTIGNTIELVQNNDVIVNLSVDGGVVYYPIKIQINNGEWESYQVTNNYVYRYDDVAITIIYNNPELLISGVVGINSFMPGDIVKIDATDWADKVRVVDHQGSMYDLDSVPPNFELIVGNTEVYIIELNSTLGFRLEDAFQDIGLIKR